MVNFWSTFSEKPGVCLPLIGKDVAQALGYSDQAKAIRIHVDEEDKGVDEMATPGGTQIVTIINESGLYSLVLSSKLPGAI